MSSHQTLLPLLLLLLFSSSAVATTAPNLQDKCADDMTKLSECLPFSTGQKDTPSDKCCGSVADIRRRDPMCLCFIMQQAHNASSQGLAGMGLRIERLLQLPAACKIKDSNVADCPKLLGLPPNSPESKFFNDTASATTGSTPVPASTTSTPTTTTSFGYHLIGNKRTIASSLAFAIMLFFSTII